MRSRADQAESPAGPACPGDSPDRLHRFTGKRSLVQAQPSSQASSKSSALGVGGCGCAGACCCALGELGEAKPPLSCCPLRSRCWACCGASPRPASTSGIPKLSYAKPARSAPDPASSHRRPAQAPAAAFRRAGPTTPSTSGIRRPPSHRRRWHGTQPRRSLSAGRRPRPLLRQPRQPRAHRGRARPRPVAPDGVSELFRSWGVPLTPCGSRPPSAHRYTRHRVHRRAPIARGRETASRSRRTPHAARRTPHAARRTPKSSSKSDRTPPQHTTYTFPPGR